MFFVYSISLIPQNIHTHQVKGHCNNKGVGEGGSKAKVFKIIYEIKTEFP